MPRQDPSKKGFTLDELKREECPPGSSYNRRCRYCKKLVHDHNRLAICPDCFNQQVGSALNGKEDSPHENN